MSFIDFGLLPILSLHTLSFIKLSHSFCNIMEITLFPVLFDAKSFHTHSPMNQFLPTH